MHRRQQTRVMPEPTRFTGESAPVPAFPSFGFRSGKIVLPAILRHVPIAMSWVNQIPEDKVAPVALEPEDEMHPHAVQG
jgi:hypothetical protein